MRLPNANVNVKWTDKQMWTITELDYEQPVQHGLMGEHGGKLTCVPNSWGVSSIGKKSWTTVVGCVNDGNHFDEQKENE